MQDAATYRQFAAECRRIAENMSVASQKETLLKMARLWDERAVEAERNEGQKK